MGAAHFNAVAQYGLIANLTSVPLMGVLVIPAAVLALVLAPLGLEIIGLWLMGLGLRWILGVAEFVAGLSGARHYVPGPGAEVLPIMALGFLLLILWNGRMRWLGLAPVVLAFALWLGVERPQALIADNGGLVGVLTAEGRALSKERGAGFIARNWLENDGDATPQDIAAARWPDQPEKDRIKVTQLGETELVHLIGKRALAGFEGCHTGQIIVASVPVEGLEDCEVYDPSRLQRTGSLAVYLRDGRPDIVTARQITGARMWNTRKRRSYADAGQKKGGG